MLVNGWSLYQHTLFQEQLARLSAEVERLAVSQPATYRELPKTKLLATVLRYVTELIPRDPGSTEFRQGNTLGPDNRHWFRAKFLRRYRLFFRFSSRERIILYVWLNDELTLRKAGSKTDPYAVFKSMLASGNPPQFLEDLFRKSEEVS